MLTFKLEKVTPPGSSLYTGATWPMQRQWGSFNQHSELLTHLTCNLSMGDRLTINGIGISIAEKKEIILLPYYKVEINCYGSFDYNILFITKYM